MLIDSSIKSSIFNLNIICVLQRMLWECCSTRYNWMPINSFVTLMFICFCWLDNWVNSLISQRNVGIHLFVVVQWSWMMSTNWSWIVSHVCLFSWSWIQSTQMHVPYVEFDCWVEVGVCQMSTNVGWTPVTWCVCVEWKLIEAKCQSTCS